MSALFRAKLLVVVVALLGVGGVTAAVATGDSEQRKFSVNLIGYEEVPAVSTLGGGTFHAAISPADDEIRYELTYGSLQGNVTQSHIHFGQKSVNGGISVFLCSNLGNGPAGTQPCPPSGTVTGTIRPADVSAGAAAAGAVAQGIAAGEFAELVKALRAGVAYTNVHSSMWPGGEIRGQLGDRDQDEGNNDGD
jgi:CHRD domain